MSYRIIDNDFDRCRQWMKDRGASSYCEEVCIGLELDGELIAAIGYGWYNTKSMHMHIAKAPGRYVTRSFLWFAFYYPFFVCGAELVISLTESGNEADRVARHAGYTLSHSIPDASPSGNINIWVLRKENAIPLNYMKRGSNYGWK